MAITYPLNTPTTIGFESITLRAVNANTTSQSPFTFKQQVISFSGERWEASVSIPPTHRDLAAPWKAMLVSLKGSVGTFLLGDPDYESPRGSAISCTITGDIGDSSVAVTMVGSLLAGDYIQLGTGANSRLHQVLVDQTGSGTLEIWPSLRDNYVAAPVNLDSPKGVFRLAGNTTEWSINNSSAYGISFEAVEVIV